MPVYHDITTEEGLRHFLEMRSAKLLKGEKVVIKFEEPENHRTQAQNNAMWKLFRMAAKKLSDAGIDARKFFKEGVEIPVTPEMLHKDAFNVIAVAMFDKTSSQLDKKQISEVGEVFMREMAKSHGIYLEWPEDPSRVG